MKNPPTGGFFYLTSVRLLQLFMKPVCLLIAFFFTSHSFAQNEMAKQFRAIFNDTANGFPHFRGEIKEVIKPKRILEYFTTSSQLFVFGLYPTARSKVFNRCSSVILSARFSWFSIFSFGIDTTI